MNTPYNSGVPHWTQKVKVFCAKVLPLVFDNTLSYIESIAKFTAKVNELCDAVNSQNMSIIEFTHMVELEIDKFEKYIETRQQEYEDQITAKWEAEKLVNQEFRETLTTEWNAWKNETDLMIRNFMASFREEWLDWKTNTETDLNNFKANLEDEQDDFENHMVALQNGFEARETQARTQFQNNLNSRLSQWQTDTLALFQQSIANWETSTRADLEHDLQVYIDQSINSAIATLSTALNQLDHNLSMERTARQEADAGLQDQINQLTPTGTIKADTPDAQGNSQLYKIDPVTQQRQNIYPIEQPQGSDDCFYFNDNNGLLLSSDFEYSTSTNRGMIITNKNAISFNGADNVIFTGAILIERDTLTRVGITDTDPQTVFTKLNFDLIPLSKTTAQNGKSSVQILNFTNSQTPSYGITWTSISGDSYLSIPLIVYKGSDGLDISANNLEFYLSVFLYKGGRTIIIEGGIGDVDSEVSTTSHNAVENQAITNFVMDNYTNNTALAQQMALKANQSALANLTNVVNEKASQTDLTTGLATKVNISDVTATPTQGSTNPISSGGVYDALQGFSPSVQDATYSTKGVVKIGANLEVNAGELSVPVASKNPDVRGVVGVGNNIKLTNGFIDVDTTTYGIKGLMSVGNNLEVDNNGNVSVPVASLQRYGVVLIGNNVNGGNGVIQVADGDYNVKGVLGVGANLTCQNSIVDVPIATAIQRGVVAVGNGIDNNNGEISVPHGTSSVYGSVRAVDSQAFTGNSDVPNMTLFNTMLAGKASTTQVAGMIKSRTPDSQGVSQMYYEDPLSGNDVNVYPALAPSSSVGRIVVPLSSYSADCDAYVTDPTNVKFGLKQITVPHSSRNTITIAINPNIIRGYDPSTPWSNIMAYNLVSNIIFTTGSYEITNVQAITPSTRRYISLTLTRMTNASTSTNSFSCISIIV